jgi:hypothetical protein
MAGVVCNAIHKLSVYIKNLFESVLDLNSRFTCHEIMTFEYTLCTLFLLAIMDLDGYQLIILYQKNTETLLCVLLVEHLH